MKTAPKFGYLENATHRKELPNDDTDHGGALGLLAAIQFSLFSIGAKFRLCWMIYRLVTGRQFRQASLSLPAMSEIRI
jgi:hypothetical protein